MCVCVLCKLGTQIEIQSAELNRIHVHVTMFVYVSHHQIGVLFTTSMCKYAVHECVYCA